MSTPDGTQFPDELIDLTELLATKIADKLYKGLFRLPPDALDDIPQPYAGGTYQYPLLPAWYASPYLEWRVTANGHIDLKLWSADHSRILWHGNLMS